MCRCRRANRVGDRYLAAVLSVGTTSWNTGQARQRACEQYRHAGVVEHRNMPPPQLWQLHMYWTCTAGCLEVEDGIEVVSWDGWLGTPASRGFG